MRISNVSFMIAAGVVGGCLGSATDQSASSINVAQLSGAIFTTLENGSAVDANIYQFKEDVYLDGGPGEKAPPGAAALPEGCYYFEVTDPGCKRLLSTDAISCREFCVDKNGLISDVLGGACAHDTGVDSDHGALTVQLFPYLNTPNPGGEYKAWITAIGDYDPGSGCFGFVPSDTKTDNFKVLRVTLPPPPPPCVCGDGKLDPGEECDDGNNVDGDGCSSTCTIECPPSSDPLT